MAVLIEFSSSSSSHPPLHTASALFPTMYGGWCMAVECWCAVEDGVDRPVEEAATAAGALIGSDSWCP